MRVQRRKYTFLVSRRRPQKRVQSGCDRRKGAPYIRRLYLNIITKRGIELLFIKFSLFHFFKNKLFLNIFLEISFQSKIDSRKTLILFFSLNEFVLRISDTNPI